MSFAHQRFWVAVVLRVSRTRGVDSVICEAGQEGGSARFANRWWLADQRSYYAEQFNRNCLHIRFY